MPYWERAYALASRGTFLADEPYSEWARERRELRTGQYRKCVHQLARLYRERGGQTQAEQVLRAYVVSHRDDEDALRPLMELLGTQERYQEALEHYEETKQALALDGYEPDARTRDIAEYVRTKHIKRERSDRVSSTLAGSSNPQFTSSSSLAGVHVITQDILAAVRELEGTLLVNIPEPTDRRTVIARLLGIPPELLALDWHSSNSFADAEPVLGADTVKRRDFNRKVLGVAATTFVASDALIDSDLLDRFNRALKKPSTLDATTLSYFRKCTENYYQDRHDANAASFDVLTYALDHFRKVTDLLEEPLLPTIRIHLTSAAGEVAQLIGELHFEIGNYTKARAYHEAAIRAAQEANNQALQSIAWGWMSFSWTYSGDEQKALICVQEARRLAAGSTNSTVRAWLAAIEAEIQANLDDLQACRKALDGAECVEDQKHSRKDSHWIHFDRSLLGGYRGICYLRLYRPGDAERTVLLGKAQKALTNALELLDPALMRRQPTYLADLASTYIRQGEVGKACEQAIQAVAIAAQIKSRMVTERLLTLRRELEPWKDTQSVKNLDGHLAPLLLSAG
jgi:tetratricopeptide (TPR) repeat protein